MNTVTLCGTLYLRNTLIKHAKGGRIFIEFHIKTLRFVSATTHRSIYDFIRCRAWGFLATHIMDNYHTGDVVCVVGPYYIDKFGSGNNLTYWHYIEVRLFEAQSINNPGFPANMPVEKTEEGQIMVQQPYTFRGTDAKDSLAKNKNGKNKKQKQQEFDLDKVPLDVNSIDW